jgi:PAS domain S-box-containing protein
MEQRGDGDAIIAGKDGVISYWPPSWEGVLGYTSSDAVGRPVDIVVPHALRKLHWRGFNKAMASGELKRDAKPFSTVGLHKTGKFVPLRALLEFTTDSGGAIDGVRGTYLGPGPKALAWAFYPALRLGQAFSKSSGR